MLNDLDLSKFDKVYIAYGRTDLRLGIDGLSCKVQQSFHMNPFSNALFLFCGRRNDRIKGLLWEGDGFLLLTKRLEEGTFKWPRTAEEVRELTPQQFRWLMEGLRIEQPRATKPINTENMVLF